MIALFKAFIGLIRGIVRDERSKMLYRGLYISDETPKTYGTKIKRRL